MVVIEEVWLERSGLRFLVSDPNVPAGTVPPLPGNFARVKIVEKIVKIRSGNNVHIYIQVSFHNLSLPWIDSHHYPLGMYPVSKPAWGDGHWVINGLGPLFRTHGIDPWPVEEIRRQDPEKLKLQVVKWEAPTCLRLKIPPPIMKAITKRY